MAAASEDYAARLALAVGELDRLIHQLRGLSQSAMRQHRKAVEETIAVLVSVATSLDGRAPSAVPKIADHALADATDVLGHDAVSALAERHDDDLLLTLAASLQDVLASTR
jgi:hypothetical protein